MKLYLDTEFNGFGGELISMALVSEHGHEWYCVRSIPPDVHPWVAEHVIPVLDEPPIGNRAFRQSLHRFMHDKSNSLIMADWPQDLEHFFASLRGEDFGSSLVIDLTAALLRETDCHPERPHNALSDARALRDWEFRRMGLLP